MWGLLNAVGRRQNQALMHAPTSCGGPSVRVCCAGLNLGWVNRLVDYKKLYRPVWDGVLCLVHAGL